MGGGYQTGLLHDQVVFLFGDGTDHRDDQAGQGQNAQQKDLYVLQNMIFHRGIPFRGGDSLAFVITTVFGFVFIIPFFFSLRKRFLIKKEPLL